MYNHDMFFFVKCFSVNDTYSSCDWMVDCAKKIHIPFPLQWCPPLEVTYHHPTDHSHQGSPTIPTIPTIPLGAVSLKVCQWVAKAKVQANHTLRSQTKHYGPRLKLMNLSSCFLTTVHLPRMVSRMRCSTRSHQNSIKSSLLNGFQRHPSPVRGNGSMYGFTASQDCRSDIDSLCYVFSSITSKPQNSLLLISHWLISAYSSLRHPVHIDSSPLTLRFVILFTLTHLRLLFASSSCSYWLTFTDSLLHLVLYKPEVPTLYFPKLDLLDIQASPFSQNS